MSEHLTKWHVKRLEAVFGLILSEKFGDDVIVRFREAKEDESKSHEESRSKAQCA